MPNYQSAWDNFATPLGMVCLILLVDWDPIGVFGNPRAMDEYDSYAPGILKLLENGEDIEQIVEHLHHRETVNMGMPPNRLRLYDVGKKLQDAYQNYKTRYGSISKPLIAAQSHNNPTASGYGVRESNKPEMAGFTKWLRRSTRFQKATQWTTGMIYIGLGFNLLRAKLRAVS